MVKTMRPVQGFPADKMFKFHFSEVHLNSKLVFKARSEQNGQNATAGESDKWKIFNRLCETIAHKKKILTESIIQYIVS